MDEKLYFMVKSQHLAAIHLICLVAALIAHRKFHNRNRLSGPEEMLHRQQVRDEILHDLSSSDKCRKLKSRLKSLKDNFSQYYDLFWGVSLSGFAWNSETKLIEAEDEVWKALIEEKPEAAKWRTKIIHHYEELSLLFTKDRATGASAATAKERTNQQNKQPIVETIDEIDQFLETNDIGLENFDTADDVNTTSTTPPSQRKLPTKLKTKKRKRKLEEEDEFTSKVLGSMNNVVDAIDRSTKVMESCRPHVYSEGEIYRELELMGLEDDDIENAYIFLVDRPDKVRALFGCPLHNRISVLAKMMGA